MRARHVPMTAARRFVADLSHFALGVPLGVVRSDISIARVRQARAASLSRMPWTIIFARAFGRVAHTVPELRQAFVKFPFHRIAEVDNSVVTIMTERSVDGETVLLPAKIKFPGDRPLSDLAADLRAVTEGDVTKVPHLRLVFGIARLPAVMRRPIWWLAFNTGLMRAIHFGTFGISVLGQGGATITRPISPLTTFLGYGPFRPDDTVELVIGFDHRVMDGGTIVRVIKALQTELDGAVSDELQALAPTS